MVSEQRAARPGRPRRCRPTRRYRVYHRVIDACPRLWRNLRRMVVGGFSPGLNEAAVEVIALCRGTLQRNRILLRTELAEDLPQASGDRVQLQQVMNLLTNASDAMKDVDDRQ